MFFLLKFPYYTGLAITEHFVLMTESGCWRLKMYHTSHSDFEQPFLSPPPPPPPTPPPPTPTHPPPTPHHSRSLLCRLHTQPHTHQTPIIFINIGPCNGLEFVRLQAITWTSTDLIPIGPLGTKLCEIGIEMQNFTFNKSGLNLKNVDHFVEPSMCYE